MPNVPETRTYETINYNMFKYGFNSSKIQIKDPLFNFYVSPSGDNNNDGLSPETPWEGIQYALEEVATKYDLFESEVRINLADGTYPTDVIRIPRFNTSANNFACQLYLRGNIANPENVIIDFSASISTDPARFNVKWVNDARLCLGGMTFVNDDTSKTIILLSDTSYLNIINPIIFEGDNDAVIKVIDNSLLIVGGAAPITINTMTSNSVFRSGAGAIIKEFAPVEVPAGETVTLANANQGWCSVFNHGVYVSNQSSITVNGTVTGRRFSITEGAIDLFGAIGTTLPSPTYFPGDIDGRIVQRAYHQTAMLGPFADDTAAATGGVELGSTYHTAAGDVKVRLV